MWVNSTVHRPVALTRSIFSYPARLAHSGKATPFSRFFRYPPSKKRVSPLQTKRLDEDHEISPVPPAHQSDYEKVEEKVSVDLGWLSAFPHVSVASMANFLFGYLIQKMGVELGVDRSWSSLQQE